MKRKIRVSVGLISSFLALWYLGSMQEGVLIGTAHAATNPSNTMLGNVFHGAAIVTQLLHFFTVIILHQLEVLLNPQFTIELFDQLSAPGCTSGNCNPLLNLWRISRDIVNILLAIMLVVGAVMTVVTANKDFIAPYARNFILAIVLVNFSWFFPRVILDVANVLTATIYSLPAAVQADCQYFPPGSPAPEECYYAESYIYFPDSPQNLIQNDFECVLNLICFMPKKMTNPITADSPSAILGGLAYSHMRLSSIPRVQASIANSGNANQSAFMRLLQDTIKVAFSMLLVCAIFFPLIALFVALLIRIPILWITISFMPFMFLGFVAGDRMGNYNTMRVIFEKFITAAFLPVVVAIPFAAGFILLSAGSLLWNSPPPAAASLQGAGSFLFVGIDTVWKLLWMVMTFAVFWMGTFAALKIDDIYAGVAQTVQNYGKAVGGFVANTAMKNTPVPGFMVGQPGQAGNLLQLKQSLSPTALNNAFGNQGRGNNSRGSGSVTQRVQRVSNNHNNNQFVNDLRGMHSANYVTNINNSGGDATTLAGNERRFHRQMKDIAADLARENLAVNEANMKAVLEEITGSPINAQLENNMKAWLQHLKDS